MTVLLTLLICCAVEWLVLCFVVPIAQRLADFSLPPPVEMAGKLLVIVLTTNLVSFGIIALIGSSLLANILALAVFWGGMVKVFEVDMFGAIIIVVMRFLVQMFVVGAIVALFLT